jgi:ADP-ribose pyrophosphatase
MQPWKLLGKQTLLSKPPWLTVESHAIELPNGRVIPDWTWVNTPDFVNVVAVTRDGQFLCFRQTKYAIEGISLAPVGGYLEPGEDPLETAKRELREETGYEAEAWHCFGKFAVDGNRGAGNAHLFLATGAHKVSEAHADDLEEMSLLLLSRDEVEAALRAGEFKLLPWAACVALAVLHSAF